MLSPLLQTRRPKLDVEAEGAYLSLILYNVLFPHTPPSLLCVFLYDVCLMCTCFFACICIYMLVHVDPEVDV